MGLITGGGWADSGALCETGASMREDGTAV